MIIAKPHAGGAWAGGRRCARLFLVQEELIRTVYDNNTVSQSCRGVSSSALPVPVGTRRGKCESILSSRA